MYNMVRSTCQLEAGGIEAGNNKTSVTRDGGSRRGFGTAVASRVCTSMPSVPRIDWSAQGGRLLVYSPGDPTGTSHVGVCDMANGLSVTPIDVHGGLVGAAQIAPDASRILVGLVERVRG